MKSLFLALTFVCLLLALPCPSPAEPLKAYVSEFTVAGTSGKDGFTVTLQRLLASRLNPEQVQLVENREKAELQIDGSYALIGRMFSVDVLLRNMGSGRITTLFEQGDNLDDLLPAMGRLAQKINGELARIPQPPVAAQALPAPSQPLPAPVAVQAAPKATPPAVATEGYIVKVDSVSNSNEANAPLEGFFTSIALGRTLPNGERELFVAGERTIRFLRTGTVQKQVAEVTIPNPGKILSIDTADLDHDGVTELYVTIVDRESLSSRVYRATDSGIELVAENLPWFFRGVGSDLATRTIVTQGMDTEGVYFDRIAELVKTGNKFETRNSQKLPSRGNIFNTTRFRSAAGAELMAVLDEDGYLAVSTIDGKELWKSSEKYGGSEANFKHESAVQMRTMGDQYRWTFIEQRIIALPDGTLIVPHNEGIFIAGNSRTYNKHTLHGLRWTGALLKEIWHTRQMQSYVTDFTYDPATHEVLLLEAVQRPGMLSNGKTALSINKID